MNLQFGARGRGPRGRLAVGLPDMNLAMATGKPHLGLGCFGQGLGPLGQQSNFAYDAVRLQQACNTWTGGWIIGPHNNMNGARNMQMNQGNVQNLENLNGKLGNFNNGGTTFGRQENHSFPPEILPRDNPNEFWDWGPKDEDNEYDNEVKISSSPHVKRSNKKHSEHRRHRSGNVKSAKYRRAGDKHVPDIRAKDEEIEEGELVESYEREKTSVDWTWGEKEDYLVAENSETNKVDGHFSGPSKSSMTVDDKKRKKAHKTCHGRHRKLRQGKKSSSCSSSFRKKNGPRKKKLAKTRERGTTVDGTAGSRTERSKKDTVEVKAEDWADDISQVNAPSDVGLPGSRECRPDQEARYYIKNTSHVSRHLARKLIHRVCRLKRHQRASRQGGDKWRENGVKAGHESPASQEIGLGEESASTSVAERRPSLPPTVMTGDGETSVSPLLYPAESPGTGHQSPIPAAKNGECHSAASSSRTPSPEIIIDDNYHRSSSSPELMETHAADEVTQALSEQNTYRSFKKSVRVAKKRLFDSEGNQNSGQERC